MAFLFDHTVSHVKIVGSINKTTGKIVDEAHFTHWAYANDSRNQNRYERMIKEMQEYLSSLSLNWDKYSLHHEEKKLGG